MTRMARKTRKIRQCIACGGLAVRPVRCPKCGAWVCSEHLGRHAETHYVMVAI